MLGCVSQMRRSSLTNRHNPTRGFGVKAIVLRGFSRLFLCGVLKSCKKADFLPEWEVSS